VKYHNYKKYVHKSVLILCEQWTEKLILRYDKGVRLPGEYVENSELYSDILSTSWVTSRYVPSQIALWPLRVFDADIKYIVVN
jgi:hypothetical protein